MDGNGIRVLEIFVKDGEREFVLVFFLFEKGVRKKEKRDVKKRRKYRCF